METQALAPTSVQIESSTPARVEWLTIFQFGLSLLAVMGMWGMAVSVFIVGAVQLSTAPALGLEAAPAFLFSLNMLGMGLLVLPSAYYALRRLLKPGKLPAVRPVSAQVFWGFSLVLALGFPLDVWLGDWVIKNETWTWLALPVLHLMAVSIPIIWLYLLGSRGISLGSPQRFWGILSSGLVLGPLIILILEVGVLLVFAILAGVYISARPDLMEELTSLSQRLSHVPNLVVAQRILTPIIQKPQVWLGLLVYGAVLVPLLEELVKPVGVWLLLRRGLTPAQGFVSGLLSGAAYAIFESLSLVNASSAWTMLVLARVGTALLHVVTTGLMGWGLVQFWPAASGTWKSGWVRLLVTYLGMVCLHGLWNSLTLITAWAELLNKFGGNPNDLLSQAGRLAPFGLGLLILFLLTLLAVVNRRVKVQSQLAGG